MFKQGFGILSLVFYCLFLAATNASANHDPSASHQKMAYEKISSGPLNFTKNIGQWPDEILYRANAGGATMWFAKTGTYYQFSRRTESKIRAMDELPESEIMMIKAEFIGSNPEPGAFGLRLMDYVCHFYFGRDSDSWYENVPNFESISLEELYPGIDLTYYGNGHHLEYDFRVSPGADYSQIKIHYDGIENLSLSEDGALVIQTQWGELREIMPLVYQEEDGIKREIQAEFEIGNNHSFGFKLGNDYNPELYAVIDPFLVYSSYLGGGSNNEYLKGIAVDTAGCVIVTGDTESSNFPLYNQYMTYLGIKSPYITKFNADGNGYIYSTYFGSAYGSFLNDVAVDEEGNFYVTGWGGAPDFPMLNPYIDCGTMQVAVISKFSPSGTLLYSTCLGGPGGYSEGFGIEVDDLDNIYVAGRVGSSDFPVANAYMSTHQGGGDFFVTKLNAAGDSLIFSTYLGGSDIEYYPKLAIDNDYFVYITGMTESDDYPQQNAYVTLDGYGPCITKLSVDGSSLVYSTDFGHITSINDIEADENGNTLIFGNSAWDDFPLVNPVQDTGDLNPNAGPFITRFSSDGSTILYSTRFPGGELIGADLDSDGNMHLIGEGAGYEGFQEINPYEWPDSLSEATFFAKLSADGQTKIHISRFSGYDPVITVDKNDEIYLAVHTGGNDYPVVGGFPDPAPSPGNKDFWLAKFTEDFDGDGINNDGDESGAYGDYPCPDGIIDDCDDNCPDIPNADQADFDGDGAGDLCDNCVDIANPDQINSDDDEYGDECDNCPNDNNSDQADSDDDNVGNVCDNCPDVSNTNQTDTDEDEVGDACDNCPDDPNYNQNDGDNDTVGDICDNCPDDINTNQENSDGDSHGDACDNCPYDTNEDQADLDDDGIGDICDLDMDGDGIDQDGDQNGTPGDNPCTGGNVTDCDDNCPITYNPGQEDSDGDGIGDACAYVCGDANGDTNVNVSDAVWIINYVFIGGDPPDPLEAGDCNCDATCNVSDAVWIINFVFIGGDDPCDTNGDDIPDC